MGSKNKAPEQKPTAQEIAQFDIAKDQWAEYRENAPPMQEMYQRLTTGMVSDGKGGVKVANDQNVLNADGSVRTDGGQADALAGAQWNNAQNQVSNPNSGAGRLGNVGLMQDRIASQGSGSTRQRLGQQNNYIRGVEGVVAMGRGQQAGALRGMQDLTGQAAQEAASAANRSFDRRSANRRLLGQTIGFVGSRQMDKFEKDKEARTPRKTMAADLGYTATPGINPGANLNNLWNK